jgi:hypothetical protein
LHPDLQGWRKARLPPHQPIVQYALRGLSQQIPSAKEALFAGTDILESEFEAATF